VKVNLDWIESEVFENEDPGRRSSNTFKRHFWYPAVFGPARAPRARSARHSFAPGCATFPYFGICFGHADGRDRSGAQSGRPSRQAKLHRIRSDAGNRWSGLMTEWPCAANELEKAFEERRISAAPCGSARNPCEVEARQPCVSEVYGGATEISERHRHRYEVNTAYKDRLEQHGLRFSGLSPDDVLPEIVEYEDHPWFIGVQFHPELKSRARLKAASAVCVGSFRPGGWWCKSAAGSDGHASRSL